MSAGPLKVTASALARLSCRRSNSWAWIALNCLIYSRSGSESRISPVISMPYALYVVREHNHEKLQAFALVSSRPVINAMSAAGHPCEVLSDSFYIHSRFGDIRDVRIGLWGPVTNVITSWHELAKSLGMVIHHFCGAEFHRENTHVLFSDVVDTPVDVLLTDSWPAGYSDPQWTLTQQHLSILGQPALLPTPPFNIGEELGFDPVGYSGFCGYEQKTVLLKVQQAIVAYLLRHRK